MNGLFETKRILITPEIAMKTLENNKIPNRNLNKSKIQYLSNVMKGGLFQCTHQGIALDTEGNIVDGQHRLAAIVLSGCSVYMMVSKGVPVDTMQVVDSMGGRTLVQRLGFSGIHTTQKTIAIARILEYGIKNVSSSKLEDVDAMKILDKYSGALSFVRSVDSSGKVISPIMSVIARAYYSQNRDKLKRFVKIYKTECPESPSETSPLRLKRVVENIKRVQKTNRTNMYSNFNEEIYWYTESALYRFLNDENVQVLQLNRHVDGKINEKERFPIVIQ